MTDAGWNSDPSGKHELRYWDGAAWTDHVSDGGVSGTDPLAPAPAAQPAPPTPSPQAAPTPTPTPPPAQPAPTPATAAASASTSKLPLIIGGVVAVVAIAAAAFFLLRGDDSRNVDDARAGLENFLDDNNAPGDVLDDPIDVGECPFGFSSKITERVTDADSDVTDVDADTNVVVVFLPPDKAAIACGVFAEDGDDGFFVDIYVTAMDKGQSAQDLVDEYKELGADTDVDIDLTDLGKAEGGEMFRACADIFILPGDNRDDFIEDPYCDTAWVSDGLIVGIEQFGSSSIGDDEAKAMVLLMLDEVLTVLEGEA